ncbi:MAG: hypothetical protein J0H89_15105, partial [Rhizobiales bacterium]|nr:hypothetical protein [Hyphomicrobiales bacterium]
MLRILVVALVLSLSAVETSAEFRGHGGPVRAVAVSPDGRSVLSGSFDTSAIRWSVSGENAEQVLRFHSDAVNAVAFLKEG